MAALDSIFSLLLSIGELLRSLGTSVINGFGMLGDYLHNAIESIIAVVSLVTGFLEFFLITFGMSQGMLPAVLYVCFMFLFLCIVAKLVVDIFL